jgi:hypothetical protein
VTVINNIKPRQSKEFRMQNNNTYPSFSFDASALAMAKGRYRRDCIR